MNIMTYKKTEHFESIAMKCTQEQFESIKPILEEFGLVKNITSFSNCNYLTNNFEGCDNFVSNIVNTSKASRNRKVHETFNAETFLKACGIVSEPLYQLTAKEIVHAYENPQYLKDTFKECFETELEPGKWYKSNYPLLLFITEIRHHELVGYGFNAKGEYTEGTFCTRADVRNKVDYDTFNFKPSTEKEVEEALVKEAIKRGYKKGFKCKFGEMKDERIITSNKFRFNFHKNRLSIGCDVIFNNGTWAEIIQLPTYTIQEAEEKFNIKIKAV